MEKTCNWCGEKCFECNKEFSSECASNCGGTITECRHIRLNKNILSIHDKSRQDVYRPGAKQYQFFFIYPNKPSASSSGPAAKYSRFGSTVVAVVGGNMIAQRPSITMGWPCCRSCPRNFPD